MVPSNHPDAPARRARFDQELAALRDLFLRHMDTEDRSALESVLTEDEDMTHHFHNVLTSATLEPEEVVKFLLGAARHLRHGSGSRRKAPLLAGIYAMIPEGR